MSRSQSQASRRPSKIRPVPINQMQTPPALLTQRRFRKGHGDQLAATLDLDKLGYPVINYREKVYWICDGQHRVYALRERGFKDELLDCEVYEDLSDREMAEIFLGRDNRKAVSPFDKFHIACTAGHKRECGIQRSVEANGAKLSETQGEGCIGAVSAVGDVYDRTGETGVGKVVRTIMGAWGGDAKAFDAALIRGIGLVFHRYGEKAHDKLLAAVLSAYPHGTRGILRRAESLRERTGNQKAACVAATIVEIFNKGQGAGPRAAGRLPAWWKEADSK